MLIFTSSFLVDSFLQLLRVLAILAGARGDVGGVDGDRRLYLHLRVVHLLVKDVEEALTQIAGLKQKK